MKFVFLSWKIFSFYNVLDWILDLFCHVCDMHQDYEIITNKISFLQILRLFSESAQSIGELKIDLTQAKKLLGAHNKQLHQLWYRSVTLRHIISLLDQIEGISKVSLFPCTYFASF